MTDKDLLVNSTTVLPTVGTLNKKPAHLIFLTDNKSKVIEKFLSLDRPEIQDGFIQVKGLYVNNEDDNKIYQSFFDILASTPKDSIVELMIPIHRISSIRNLVFKAK